MKRWFIGSIGMAICIIPSFSASAQSQEWWPELRDETVSTDCSSIEGIALSYYDLVAGSWDMYVSSDICLDIENGSLSAPEPMEGLQQTMSLGAGSMLLEVIEDADRQHQRRYMTAVPVPSIMDAMGGAAKTEPFDLYQLNINAPRDRIQLFPHATAMRGEAFAFRTPRNDIDVLPEGRWLMSAAVTPSKGPVADRRVTSTSLHGSASMLIGSSPEGPRVLGITSRQRDPELEMNVSAGRVSGSISYAFDNELLPAARAPGEWESAEVQIREFEGRIIEIGGTLNFVAHGVGRVVLTGEDGETSVLGAGASILGLFVPEQISDEMALQMFDYQ